MNFLADGSVSFLFTEYIWVQSIEFLKSTLWPLWLKKANLTIYLSVNLTLNSDYSPSTFELDISWTSLKINQEEKSLSIELGRKNYIVSI